MIFDWALRITGHKQNKFDNEVVADIRSLKVSMRQCSRQAQERLECNIQRHKRRVAFQLILFCVVTIGLTTAIVLS